MQDTSNWGILILLVSRVWRRHLLGETMILLVSRVWGRWLLGGGMYEYISWPSRISGVSYSMGARSCTPVPATTRRGGTDGKNDTESSWNAQEHEDEDGTNHTPNDSSRRTGPCEC